MVPQKFQIQAKLAQGFHKDALIKMLHRWIREGAVPGILLDVADYAHVPDGPGVLLVGHEVDYGFEGSWLVVSWKTKRMSKQGSFEDAFSAAWEAVREAIAQIGLAEELDAGGVDVSEYEVSVLDRLLVPNGEEIPTEIIKVVAEVTGRKVSVKVLEDERLPAALALA